MTRGEAKAYRAAIEALSINATDTIALQAKIIYPEWKDLIGKETKNYPRFRYGDGLWKVRSPHIFSEEWVPGMATASLYTRIEIEHTGTKEDPIPWAQNMVLYKDKYYTQNDVLYLCIRDSGNPLAYDLSVLIGLYVQVVEEAK